MRLISLDLHNFRQHRETNISFFDGITGIVGPNGSGKSTLLEAIAWALYGQDAVRRMKRGLAETIRSRGSSGKDPAQVTLVFEMGGQTYTAVRRENDAALISGDVKLATGTSGVNAAVSRLLSMDASEFFSSFFTCQKDLTFLNEISKSKRQEHIAKLLGYEKLAKARKAANEDKVAANNVIEGLEKGLGDPADIESRLSAARTALAVADKALAQRERSYAEAAKASEELSPKVAANEKLRLQHSELETQIRLLENSRDLRLGNLSETKAELAAIQSAEDELKQLGGVQEEYESLRERNDQLVSLQQDHKDRLNCEEQISALTKEIGQLNAEIAGFQAKSAGVAAARASEARALEQLQKARRAAQALEQNWAQSRAEAAQTASSQRSQAAAIRDHLRQLLQAGPDGCCPTCERPLHGEFESVTGEMQRQIESLEASAADAAGQAEALQQPGAEVAAARKEVESADTALRSIQKAVTTAEQAAEILADRQKRLTQLQAKVKDYQTKIATLAVGYDEAELKSLRARAQELKPAVERSRHLMAVVLQRTQVDARLQQHEQQLQLLQSDLKSKTSQIQALAFDEKAASELKARYEQAKQHLEEEGRLIAAAMTQQAAAAATSEQASQEMQRYKERSQALVAKREEARYLECLVRCFDLLREQLNKQIRPRLSQTASELLCDVTDARYTHLTLDDDYTPVLYNDDGEQQDVISGGEEDIAHLVVRLAISQMIAESAGVDLGLLVLDEVFGALDANRRSRVIELLQNLRGSFRQILLITHIDEIHDLVDRCLWISCDTSTQTSAVSDAIGLPDQAGVKEGAGVAGRLF